MSPKIRPERSSEASQSKELHEARREVKALRKLVGRLQKTIQKYERERGIALVLEEADPEPAAVEPVAELAPVTIGCACGSANYVTFTTPSGKKLIRCKACKASL